MIKIQQSLRLATEWEDYVLLDTGDGRRLERWADYTLVRPDPQVIWRPAKPDLWKDVDAFYQRTNAGGGHWEIRRPLPEFWTVKYGRLRFKVKPTGFKHMGLFPEQAVNWDWIAERIRGAARPVKVLNLFGYTGGATVAAASAGAKVCHVDSARGVVQWCRENMALSNLTDAPVRYIVEDCLTFIRREQRRGQRYDALMMDPPSFGRGNKGEVWKLEHQLPLLLNECVKIFSDQPLFFLVNAYTTGLSAIALTNLLSDVLAKFAGNIKGGELGLRARKGRRILPCGIYGCWESI